MNIFKIYEIIDIFVKEKYSNLNVSIILLGEDKDFLREINISQEVY